MTRVFFLTMVTFTITFITIQQMLVAEDEVPEWKSIIQGDIYCKRYGIEDGSTEKYSKVRAVFGTSELILPCSLKTQPVVRCFLYEKTGREQHEEVPFTAEKIDSNTVFMHLRVRLKTPDRREEKTSSGYGYLVNIYYVNSIFTARRILLAVSTFWQSAPIAKEDYAHPLIGDDICFYLKERIPCIRNDRLYFIRDCTVFEIFLADRDFDIVKIAQEIDTKYKNMNVQLNFQ